MRSMAILGPKNTFSDVAYKEYCQKEKSAFLPIYFDSLEEVVKAVKEKTDYAIIPIENTLDGYLPGMLDLILENKLFIIRSLCIPIQFSLVSNADSINDIKCIYVQYKAKSQCMKFLLKNKFIEIKITDSNMKSLELMKEEGEAAIIPRHAYYEKRFGIDNVTDALENETRFIILTKEYVSNCHNERLKVTLCITALEDKPGILYFVLGEFARKGLNLSSIMSRPTKEKMGKYNFYIDLDILNSQKNLVLETIEEFNKNNTIKVINLGIYDA